MRTAQARKSSRRTLSRALTAAREFLWPCKGPRSVLPPVFVRRVFEPAHSSSAYSSVELALTWMSRCVPYTDVQGAERGPQTRTDVWNFGRVSVRKSAFGRSSPSCMHPAPAPAPRSASIRSLVTPRTSMPRLPPHLASPAKSATHSREPASQPVRILPSTPSP